jgi:hypothetical protein
MHIYDIMAAPKHLRRGDYPYGGLRSRSGGLRSPIWGSEIPDPGVPTRVRGPDLGSGVPIWGPGSRSGSGVPIRVRGPDPGPGSRSGVRGPDPPGVPIPGSETPQEGPAGPHVGDYPSHRPYLPIFTIYAIMHSCRIMCNSPFWPNLSSNVFHA